MTILPRIWFPLAVLSFACAAVLDFGHTPASKNSGETYLFAANPSQHLGNSNSTISTSDTVIYPPYGFKKGISAEELAQNFVIDESEDTLSLSDSSIAKSKISPRDSLRALLDSTLWDKIDSIYLADSSAKAKAKFDAWYAALSPKERKLYDKEQRAKLKMAQADSLRDAKQRQQDIRDSILAETPRILETYALPDSMQFKRIIQWTVDQEFNRMSISIPDTGYNYHFYDYPFLQKDVNASWLGVAGSPVEYYNFFLRGSDEQVDFYQAQEPWSYSPRTLPHYNTKTPYTELAYWGPLFASRVKESDNIHILTTQNVTPELNLTLLYNRYGGGGMLAREKTVNKTFALYSNYLGKKYTLHAGFIRNSVEREENGGIADVKWIRDTTVDSREINVHLRNADSKIQKNTFYLNQQLRIPFNFIAKAKAQKDSTFVFDADSLDRDITTAFIGHSSELSFYGRKYTDVLSSDAEKSYFDNVMIYDNGISQDSLGVMQLDNKVYMRLQPWSSESIVSKLDLGTGYRLRNYHDSEPNRPKKHTEGSFYIYAGAEGQLRNSFYWNAGARMALLGYNPGDFRIEANGSYSFYPFRRARKSPVSLSAHFETSLTEPQWYQQHIYSNHFRWDNKFHKSSTTIIQGGLDIARWQTKLSVGYALLAGNLWYDEKGIIRQNDKAMSVLSADLRKDFSLGPLHLDHKVLFQISSNQNVLPLPRLALNLRYYFQFVVQRSEDNKRNIMVMQLGANAFYNTPWHSPAWNPALGVFHNQSEQLYTNGPYFDVFVNVQWKRACIFVKYQNAGGGWPMRKLDYFSSDRYIITRNGMDGLKIGIFWPFYAEPFGRPEAPQK